MAVYRIAIIEDDEVIAQAEKEALEKWDYQVECITDFKNITQEVIRWKPELIVLDIKLPFYNGFYWCQQIRQVTKAPVVFVSSADDNMNIVMAMDMGGDDFIAKPFDLSVLVAKINALLRRSYAYQGQINVLEVQGLLLNLSETSMCYEGETVELSKNEFRILQILMENEGNMVTRDTIINQLWDSGEFIDDNTLSVNVTRLRKRLKSLGLDDYIKTKRGVGYRI